MAIGQVTRKLIGGQFELDDPGGKRLKGFAEPLPVWRVVGESPAEGRFEAGHTTDLTPLVGREEEIALLLRHWQQAREGDGQVVLLEGEPGIGKSRLVLALRERLRSEPHITLRYEAKVRLVRGEALLAGNAQERTRGERGVRAALDVSRRQGARSMELRSATRLGRLWADAGKRAQARDLLTPVYGWFSEGFDTPDLIDAKALLDELS